MGLFFVGYRFFLKKKKAFFFGWRAGSLVSWLNLASSDRILCLRRVNSDQVNGPRDCGPSAFCMKCMRSVYEKSWFLSFCAPALHNGQKTIFTWRERLPSIRVFSLRHRDASFRSQYNTVGDIASISQPMSRPSSISVRNLVEKKAR